MRMTNTNRIAVITGGGRGIGRSIALALADKGLDVVITWHSAEDRAEAVAEEVRAKGRRAVTLQLDVAKTTSFSAFTSALRDALETTWRTTKFDVLVHNGASGAGALFSDVTEALFDRLLDEHFKGPFFLTQALLELLADGGRVVHVGTGLTRYVFAGQSVYSAAKAAIEMLTRSLAVELGPRGITVNAVAPGGIVTEFAGSAMHDSALQQAVIAQTPLGRMGQPEDVSGAVAFLVSDDARWVTGQRLELTGGFRL